MSGHHDGEQRNISTFLPTDKASKVQKIIMYCHLCFYETPLEDMATKGLPGGGLDSNTTAGGGPIEPKRAVGAAKRVGISADELKNALNSDADAQIGKALADMGAAQVAYAKRQDEIAKRQKIDWMCDLKAKGVLSAEQHAPLAKAIDKQLQDLL